MKKLRLPLLLTFSPSLLAGCNQNAAPDPYRPFRDQPLQW